MTSAADFASPDYFRNPAAAIERLRARGSGRARCASPSIGRVWAHDDAGARRSGAQGHRDLHHAQGGRHVAGLPLVDARHRAQPCQQHAVDGRARPQAVARHRRRGLPPPRRARHGAAYSGHRRRNSPTNCLPTAARPISSQRFARKLPLSVICELLGLPAADRPKFVRLGRRVSRASPARWDFSARSRIVVRDEALPRTASRNGAPARRGGVDRRDRARREGGRTISRDEIVAMVFLLLFAGHETTTHLISGSVHRAPEKSSTARLAGRGLEPRRSRGGGISALHLAGAIHQAALRAPRYRARRRQLVKRGTDHGHAGGRQHGPVRPIRIPSGSTCSGGPTVTSPSAPASTSASAISSRASKAKCALKALFRRWPQLTLAVDESEITWRKRPGLNAIERLPVVPARRTNSSGKGSDGFLVALWLPHAQRLLRRLQHRRFNPLSRKPAWSTTAAFWPHPSMKS